MSCDLGCFISSSNHKLPGFVSFIGHLGTDCSLFFYFSRLEWVLILLFFYYNFFLLRPPHRLGSAVDCDIMSACVFMAHCYGTVWIVFLHFNGSEKQTVAWP